MLLELEEARHDLLRAVEGLSEMGMMRPLTESSWSAKDILLHVASWDELRCFEIARVTRGDRPLYAELREDDFAAWNAILMSVRRDLSCDQVLRELNHARENVLAVIASVPDETLAEVAPGRGRIRRAAAHDREHAAQLREGRERARLR